MQSDKPNAENGEMRVGNGSILHSPFSKSMYFWPILIAVVATDVVTKALAVTSFGPLQRVPHEVFGEYVRFTLVYNPGAAFGLHVGEYSRWVFLVLTIGALLILGRLYVSSSSGDRPRIVSLALVCGGAIGNLIDRIRHERGVVDFLDVGVGDARWPTFNVADMAVSIGAFLLAIVLWAEDRPAEGSRVGLVSNELRHESGEAT
jgi:signal peptidase II